MPLHERLNLAKPVIESVEAAPFELTFQDYHPLDRIHAVFRQQRLHHVGGGQGDETEAEAGKNEKEKSDDDDGEEDDDDNASFFPTDGLLFVPVYTPYRCVSCVVCRVSCVVCRVSCVVCRVSCVVCRVSCVVRVVSCALTQ
jgi:hypothetical protein